MQITDLLAQTGGLESLARELGIDPQQAASAATALAPAIMSGFQKHEAATGGGLGELLGKLGGGGMMEQVLAQGPTDVTAGNEVLGQIFGSKDVSRSVAESASAQSGLSPELLKKMLPMLTMLMGGFMAKGGTDANEGAGTGGVGGLLGSLLGGGQNTGSAAGAGGLLGRLGSMLDANGDGNALDDILRMVNKGGR